MTAPTTDRPHRLGYLDALRGIAALSVVYLHFSMDLAERSAQSIGPAALSFIHVTTLVFDPGKFGVVLFFAISGFIIPNSLLVDQPTPIRRFVIARFFRLYPLYWLTIPLGLMLPWPEPGKLFSTATILANTTMVQGYLGYEDVIGAYWTLQIELLFYALCVGLFAAGLLRRPGAVFAAGAGALLLALGLALARFALHRKFPVALPLALGVMFWGTLWRAWIDRASPRAGADALRLTALFAVLLPLICVAGYSEDFGYHETWYRYLLSYSAAMAVFAFGTTVLRLEWSWLVRCGTISYSIYLLHPIAAAVAMGVVSADAPASRFLCAVLLVLIAAELCYRYVERPAIRLGRRVAASAAVAGKPRPPPLPGTASALAGRGTLDRPSEEVL